MVDLQTHSTYSDGSLTPTELVKEASQKGIYAIALTDHDTIEGLPEFLEAGKVYGVKTVPGVEISVEAEMPPTGHLHLLGLFVDYHNLSFKEKLEFLRTHRKIRAQKMAAKLNEMGIKISDEELQEIAGKTVIGRIHFARILKNKGIVNSLQEAFGQYIGKGKPAYVNKLKFKEKEAIQIIKDAGGLVILAHPHLMNYEKETDLERKILYLKSLGLDGIETFSTNLSETLSGHLLEFARKYHLAVSGGSDYHGVNKHGIALGTGNGNLNIPDSVYHDLYKRWRKLREKE
jgi:predicted metal-dependent phosphoesterase TrpH